MIFTVFLSLCVECDFEETHLCGYRNQWNTNVNWYIGGVLVQPVTGSARRMGEEPQKPPLPPLPGSPVRGSLNCSPHRSS